MFLHLSVILFTGGKVSVQGGFVQGISVCGSLSGGLCPRVSVQGGLNLRDSPSTVTCGQYASYWNTFLLLSFYCHQINGQQMGLSPILPVIHTINMQ